MPGLIDAHVHLGGGKYAAPAEWAAAEARLGLDATVLVQHLGQTDNSELLAVAAVAPDRYAVVGIPDGLGAAEALLDEGAVGFRVGPRGLHAQPDEAVFAVLGARGAVASVTGPYEEVADPAFAAIVDRHPQVAFRLEHLAAFPFAELAGPVRRFAPVLELARRENVSIMWSGFFHYSRAGHPYRDAWPVLEASLAAFGAERICWSGDWNRADGTDETYRADLALLDGLPFVDATAAEAIRGTTARRIFWKDAT